MDARKKYQTNNLTSPSMLELGLGLGLGLFFNLLSLVICRTHFVVCRTEENFFAICRTTLVSCRTEMNLWLSAGISGYLQDYSVICRILWLSAGLNYVICRILWLSAGLVIILVICRILTLSP